MMDQPRNEKPAAKQDGKIPLSPVQEALAKQAAMRPVRTPVRLVSAPQSLPKVKMGRKNRRKIPK